MALTKTPRAHGIHTAPLSHTRPEMITREMRVEELRRMVARGDYKVDPQRLALRVLCRALGVYSPENRT